MISLRENFEERHCRYIYIYSFIIFITEHIQDKSWSSNVTGEEVMKKRMSCS